MEREPKNNIPPSARDRLWHRFHATGKVEDYLRYVRGDDTEFAEELTEEEEEPKE